VGPLLAARTDPVPVSPDAFESPGLVYRVAFCLCVFARIPVRVIRACADLPDVRKTDKKPSHEKGI
jgi:hypothetical protein